MKFTVKEVSQEAPKAPQNEASTGHQLVVTKQVSVRVMEVPVT
jgi:hypothetical protein